MLAAIGAVSIYTPFLSDKYYEIWFTWPGIAALVLMPLVVAVIGVMFVPSRHQHAHAGQAWNTCCCALRRIPDPTNGSNDIAIGRSTAPNMDNPNRLKSG